MNGALVKAGAKLRTGDRILLSEPPPVPIGTQAEDIALEVLFEDESLIVINKDCPAWSFTPPPAIGMARSSTPFSTIAPPLSGIGGELRPGIVHRLDKETSGCLVAAKSDAAHQALTRQFAAREVTKSTSPSPPAISPGRAVSSKRPSAGILSIARK